MKSSQEILAKVNEAIEKFVGNDPKTFIEFTGKEMEFPITHIHISTGIYNSRFYLVEDSDGLEQMAHELTVEVTVCAPKTIVGDELITNVDAIIGSAFREGMPKVIEIHTGKASYNSTIGAIIQSIYITFEA